MIIILEKSKRNFVVVLLLIATLLTWCFALKVNVFANSNNLSNAELLELYTNSDKLYGDIAEDFNIRNYAESMKNSENNLPILCMDNYGSINYGDISDLYASNIEYKINEEYGVRELFVYADDPIVKIVPNP